VSAPRRGLGSAAVRPPILLALAVLLAAGCVASVEPGEPALPPGFEDIGVPDVDVNAYLYLYLGEGTPLTLPPFALGDEELEPINVVRVEAALRDPGADQAAWLQTLDGEALFFSVAETSWSAGIAAAWRDGQRVSVEARYPDVWETIRLLPEQPPGRPVAIGFVRNAGDLADDVLALQDIQVPGLGSALGLIRVRTLAFGAYADDLSSLPATLTPEMIRDAGVGIVAVGKAGYPDALANFLIGRFAGQLGLGDATVAGEKAYDRSLPEGLYLVMKSYGATLYLVVAGSREHAEALLGAVIADQP